MPHWDFKCSTCGRVYDKAFPSFNVMRDLSNGLLCGAPCRGFLVRMASAPRFTMTGFREENGYASPVSIEKRHGGGIKTKIEGDLEILRDWK